MNQYLKVALQAMSEIKPLLKKNFGNPEKVKSKKDGTLVTEVDIEAEEIIREVIKAHFPHHGIMGEELERVNPKSEFQWILDPIDGTNDFIRGIPTYGSIIALFQRSEPILGVIQVPETGSIYHAIKNEGAFWNNRQIKLKELKGEDMFSDYISVSTRLGFERSGYTEAYDNIFKNHPKVKILANCYGHGLATRGAVSAMVNFNISLWDIAATKILMEEAGGKFVVQKRKDSMNRTMYDMIAGKANMVDWLTDYFKIEVSPENLL